MPSVAEYVASRAPSYVGDSRLGAFETQAALETGSAYGVLKNKATFLLIMHWFALDDRGAAVGSSGGTEIGGTIKREKEGSLEREYMLDFSLTARYPDLSQTRWGLELLSLRKKTIFGPRSRFTTAS